LNPDEMDQECKRLLSERCRALRDQWISGSSERRVQREEEEEEEEDAARRAPGGPRSAAQPSRRR